MYASKGFTNNFFINRIKSNKKRINSDPESLYDCVSPRFGGGSKMSYALDDLLCNRTNEILAGKGNYAKLGKTPRARVLRVLQERAKTRNQVDLFDLIGE